MIRLSRGTKIPKVSVFSKSPASPDEDFPLLPLRELVLFPQTVIPMFVTYKAGIAAVEAALGRGERLFAACLKAPPEGGPPPNSVYPGETHPVGTVVRIIQHLKLPDSTYRVVLQGEFRGTVLSTAEQPDYSVVRVEPIEGNAREGGLEITALIRAVQKSFVQYAELSKKVSTETLTAVEKTESPERLGNLIGNTLSIKSERKLELLRLEGTVERLERLLEILELENEIFGIQKNISGKVKSRMEKNQREYILHEQLKEINKELGKDGGEDEFADLERAVADRHPPEEVLLKARKELTRLRKLQPLSPEAGVLRGYLEWIADLPWSEASADSGDLPAAEKILNEDHFDMYKAKERILEFIAVRELGAREQAAAEQAAEAVRADDGGAEAVPTDAVPTDAGGAVPTDAGQAADAVRADADGAEAVPTDAVPVDAGQAADAVPTDAGEDPEAGSGPGEAAWGPRIAPSGS
jgi:ATP-dependent Lon protease